MWLMWLDWVDAGLKSSFDSMWDEAIYDSSNDEGCFRSHDILHILHILLYLSQVEPLYQLA